MCETANHHRVILSTIYFEDGAEGTRAAQQGMILPLGYDTPSCSTDSIHRYKHATDMQVWLLRS